MPPRRSRRIVGSVIRTTTKVVQETVEVAVVKKDSESLTQGPETAAESSGGEEFRRTIPVEEMAPAPKQPQTLPPSEDSEPNKKPTDSTSQITEDKSEPEAKNVKKKSEKKRESQGGGRRRRRRKTGGGGGEGYKRYVFRVLKQVHPGMGISGQAMVILNNLMSDMFERLAEEATRLSKYTGGMTLSSREIQGAVRLVLPGELGKHAIAEGIKAVSSYVANSGGPKH